MDRSRHCVIWSSGSGAVLQLRTRSIGARASGTALQAMTAGAPTNVVKHWRPCRPTLFLHNKFLHRQRISAPVQTDRRWAQPRQQCTPARSLPPQAEEQPSPAQPQPQQPEQEGDTPSFLTGVNWSVTRGQRRGSGGVLLCSLHVPSNTVCFASSPSKLPALSTAHLPTGIAMLRWACCF